MYICKYFVVKSIPNVVVIIIIILYRLILRISAYLTPWPGPHLMLLINKLFVPGPIDMQSSPVCMVLPLIVTPVEVCTWMPSVFGLRSGAISFTFWTTTLLHLLITRWVSWLLIDVKPLTTILFAQLNVIDCIDTQIALLK